MMNDPRLDPDDPLNWDDAAESTNIDWPELYQPSLNRDMGAVFPWADAWRLAILRPTLANYQKLLNDPTASLQRANAWIATAGFVATVFLSLLTASGRNAVASAALCLAPFGAIAFLVVSLIMMMSIHSVAQSLGGDANFNNTAYGLALSFTPLITIYSIPGIMLSILFPGSSLAVIIFSLGIPAIIYQFGLSVMVIHLTHGLGWAEAAIAALAPYILMYGCGCSCITLIYASGASNF